ncbi:MAG: 5'/3'-nucleotidase SurE [Lachnospiraceae bacterium]|nr:5'/3'-nucleotidase SurE [Lachnospiraceae bacterium]
MKILITNDDGITCEGIHKLAEIAVNFGEVWVVAPAGQCTAMSRCLTLRETLEIKEADFPVKNVHAYSVSGTPVDCVKVGANVIMKEKPDYVFSGINWGYNAGADIAYSGTIGASMESLLNGIPTIAFSNEGVSDYTIAMKYLPDIITEILKKEPDHSAIWNINTPACSLDDCKGILWDRTIFKESYYAGVYEEKGDPSIIKLELSPTRIPVEKLPVETDIGALVRNYISVGKVKSEILL